MWVRFSQIANQVSVDGKKSKENFLQKFFLKYMITITVRAAMTQ